MLVTTGRSPIIGEDRRAIAIRIGINELQRSFIRGDSQDGQNWPKDFVGVDRHVGCHVVKQCWPEPEATRFSIDGGFTAVHNNGGARIHAGLNVTSDLVAMFAGHQRPHVARTATITGD